MGNDYVTNYEIKKKKKSLSLSLSFPLFSWQQSGPTTKT